VLANAAAGAAGFDDLHFPGLQFDRYFTDRAVFDADRAFLAVGANAGLLVPHGGAHVDVLNRDRRQGAAGAGVHAE
jgi:hypothetical protein